MAGKPEVRKSSLLHSEIRICLMAVCALCARSGRLLNFGESCSDPARLLDRPANDRRNADCTSVKRLGSIPPPSGTGHKDVSPNVDGSDTRGAGTALDHLGLQHDL